MTTETWSIVIPYYNEKEYLEATLACIAHQIQKPDQVILINNASSDSSEKIAHKFKEKYDNFFDVILLNEDKLGKIFALMTASKCVKTSYFAVWDADTHYPPNYLKKASEAYSKKTKKPVAVMATSLKNSSISLKNIIRILKIQILSRIYTSECHAGGYAETFNTELYKKVGGFDNQIWPYMFEDHEIVQRLLKIGDIVYPLGLWCIVSSRRCDRSKITWTKTEKLIYRYTPFLLKDWFFYSFLAPRFEKRGLNIIELRKQPWKENN
ncbi:hypothetical protein ACI01nite_00020 [Acetobacter cibinongensis]|uniref:Glycosyl transferase family 2 n=1 Tax=Acetobacter cibinongensis TaxID=146475 RepID=A0A0D6N7G9_9PROT|nr:glycosyltransferase family A protein [Acetobacter cibinongensis]GAN61508.1 glycosyl transferase family 2 [Acetobacter cibinongensis]GBQ15947.1 glycosyl transferase [Acetobacter cibinongensis NRIC 0482]GEL57400.1 hypothetical protein ACI01nite_00020 [Acetobacter cibinongensis]